MARLMAIVELFETLAVTVGALGGLEFLGWVFWRVCQ